MLLLLSTTGYSPRLVVGGAYGVRWWAGLMGCVDVWGLRDVLMCGA